MNLVFSADPEDIGKRADVYLSEQLPDRSRSYLQKLLKDGLVRAGEKEIRPNYRLREEDVIRLELPENQEPEIRAEDIPLDILYEDDDLLIVNKPKGMVVHPAPGHEDHTLVNALLYHCRGHLSGINGVLRPGIVHRIDKDTTGALVVCKNDQAHHALAEQLAVHSITRRYRAICIGSIKEELRIEGNIGRHATDRKKMAVVPEGRGKPALTIVRPLTALRGCTYIECELHTGRTHQIRVHLASRGFPILGDTVYGPQKQPVKGIEGQVLHAMVLGFVHPSTKEYLEIQAPLPEEFLLLLEKLTL